MNMSRFFTVRWTVAAVIAVLALVVRGEAQTKEESPVKVTQNENIVLGIDLGTTYSVVSMYNPTKASVEIASFGLGRNTLPSFIKMNIASQADALPLAKEELARAKEKYADKPYYFYQGVWLAKNQDQMIKPVVGWEALDQMKEENSDLSVKNSIYRFKPLMARSSKEADDDFVIRETREKVKYTIQERVEILTKEEEKVREQERIARREPKTNEITKVLAIVITDENNKEVGWTTPKDLSAMVLETLKYRVNKLLNDHRTSRKCVVTVPAYFNDKQKLETRFAARLAGLNVLDEGIINEPTSAAIAYAYTCARKTSVEELGGMEFLVFDWGGGTLDLSYLTLENKNLDVKAHSGDNFLGGENGNDLIYDYFVKTMKDQGTITKEKDLDVNTTIRLRHLVEKMKIDVCEQQNVIDVRIREKAKAEGAKADYSGAENNAVVKETFFISEALGSIDLSLSTERMNELFRVLYDKIRALIFNKATSSNNKTDGILNKINKTKGEVKNILYVGGSSRIPGARRLLMDIFDQADHCFELDADTCVSVGAAYHAAAHENLIESKDYIALIDALPMNMGIRLHDDVFDVMAKAGTQVPNRFHKTFATTSDGQKSVQIDIGQTPTETRRFTSTKTVGQFKLDMPENNQPKGKKLIEVTFDFGGGGDIEVEAKEIGNEKGEDNVHKITIKKQDSFMKQEEVEEMYEKYEKIRHEEDIWAAKGEAVRAFERLLDEILARAGTFDEGSDKRGELSRLHSENQYWLEHEIKNQTSLKDETLLDKVQEKTSELRAAFEALAASSEEAQPEEKAEEDYIPRDDL
ncbi:heat shock 7kDa protein 1/8 [Nematocida displodere]|uniref:Heat shock 7kDa protein 1/8 n=1 Tax=Nematocida displodere TaxID=1805483 RepID=A0A177EEJ8_9MICR|nr:heat shock 7kDa protein 1/8 [Nematocida displodere]